MDLNTREGRREQGLLIQKVVERAGLSVEELANRIGCSRALIYQYLSGTTLAQPDRLQQIALETGVPLSYFYSGELPDERRGRKPQAPDAAEARIAERIHHLEDLASAQESPADWAGLASTCERLISLAGQTDDLPFEARAWQRLGRARIHAGEFTRSIECLQHAADLFRQLGDEKGEADARQGLGGAFLATSRMEEAREQFEWVAASDRWEARWSGLVSLAAVDEQAGDYRAAMAHCDEAAAILEKGREPAAVATGMLYVNTNRVNLYLAGGDFKSASALAAQCLASAEALGNGDQHLEARLNLGYCALYLGNWAQGHRILSNALPVARFMGDRSREAMVRTVLAMVLAAMGDFDSASAHAKDALASALALGDHRAELFAQMALADAYAGPQRSSESRYHASQALAVASAMRLLPFQAECRLRLARLALRGRASALADIPEALEHIERALQLAEQLGARHIQAQALTLRTDWRLKHAMLEPAAQDLALALALAAEMEMKPLAWEAEWLHARVACAYEPPRSTEANDAAERAVRLIESVREELREAGIPDTVLESPERQDIYLERAKLLADDGRVEEARLFIQQSSWPPLDRLFSRGAALNVAEVRGESG